VASFARQQVKALRCSRGAEFKLDVSLNKLGQQAGVICTLAGSNQLIAKRDSLIAELKALFVPKTAPALV